MRVYLAGSTRHRVYLQRLAEELEQADHLVVSSWLLPGAELPDDPTDGELASRAEADLFDILTADALVLYNIADHGHGNGRQVELGYALGIPLRRIVLLGDRTNIFHWLPQLTWVRTEAELFEELGVPPRAWRQSVRDLTAPT